MVDKFIMFFVFQSSLEGLDAFGPRKAEHIDQLIEVYSYACSVGAGTVELEARLFEIEDLCVVLSVLDGIISITAGHNLNFFQLCRVNVQRDVEAIVKIQGLDGIPHRGLAEIRKVNGVFRHDRYSIVAIGIGGGATARSAEDADSIEWSCPVHIIYCTMYGDLPPGLAADKERQNG